MSKIIEKYKGHEIKECAWGYCVDYKHTSSLNHARQLIDAMVSKKTTNLTDLDNSNNSNEEK